MTMMHSATITAATHRKAGRDPDQFEPADRVVPRNQAEMNVAAAVNEAAIRDRPRPRQWVQAVTRMPAIRAARRPTARMWTWWVTAFGTCEKYR
jgi:hypothetical protein